MEAEARGLKKYTVEDIMNLPDGERAELIDGQIYYMSPPNTRHQEISGDIFFVIKDHIKKNGGNCKVYAAPFAVFLEKETYVERDISVICDLDKIDDRGCNGAPDWVIEIVSPSTSHRDYFHKLFKYRKAGVREYWIVDPKKENIDIFNFEKENKEDYSFGEDVPSGVIDGLFVKIPTE